MTNTEPATPGSAVNADTTAWLLRISSVFADSTADVLRLYTPSLWTPLAQEYFLVRSPNPNIFVTRNGPPFVRWNMPVDHSWPCNPQKMENFIEKGAQTLRQRFAPFSPQTIVMGALDPGSPSPYYKGIASNLRGRTLQLFPPLSCPAQEVENQDPALPTLFCLVGKEGLFCGLSSPRASNGFYPGGTKFISQNSPDTISRAGAKIAEALHYLTLYRPPHLLGNHWLELGASPGGMTAELLNHGQRVTAVDRAPLDIRLKNKKGLTFILEGAAHFTPPPGAIYDALLCDMNGDPADSLQQVIRLSHHLSSGATIVFTLKTTGTTTIDETTLLHRRIIAMAAAANLHLFAQTHLTYNRHEFTLFFEFTEGSPSINPSVATQS